MIIFCVLIGLLCLYKIKLPLAKHEGYSNGFYEDYMSLEKTTSIKGIFILIVFLQHSMSYLQSYNILDSSCQFLIGSVIGQAMVSCFLLFSGYGVMMSIDKKGYQYVKSIPYKRVLKVLIHFDIAVLIFYVLDLILGKSIEPTQLLLSFTGWSSVGNSNWYIFDILVLYLLTFVSFIAFKDKKKIGLIVNVLLCAVMFLVLHKFKETWWYDTLMCYPVGMIFYYIKPYIDSILKKNKAIYWIALACLLVVFAFSYKFSSNLLVLVVKNIVFPVIVIFITMKFSINNKILHFFGKHLFSIYILQRIPMNILDHFGFNTNNYLFVIISFIVTVIIAVAFDYLINKLDSLLFSNKKATANK